MKLSIVGFINSIKNLNGLKHNFKAHVTQKDKDGWLILTL